MPYLLTPEQHRQEAERLRRRRPDSRAAQLHELAAAMQERLRTGESIAWLPNAPSIVPVRDDLGCR
jgi:hypothetical protein